MFLSITSLKCSLPQAIRALRTGINDFPVSVREYSTRGGTSGYTSRCTRWLCSRFFNVWESIFCEQSVIWRRSSLNRSTPASLVWSIYNTNKDHLSPKRLTTCLIGQARYSAFTSVLFSWCKGTAVFPALQEGTFWWDSYQKVGIECPCAFNKNDFNWI